MSYISLKQINDVESRAAEGDFDAQLSMCSLYTSGQSLVADYEKAMDYLDDALAQAQSPDDFQAIAQSASSLSQKVESEINTQVGADTPLHAASFFQAKASGEDVSAVEGNIRVQSRVGAMLASLENNLPEHSL